MSGWLFALTLATALGCGLAAGVFFAFSSFVMAGLRQLDSAQGIAAMQSINRTAVQPAFMVALNGTALLCVAVVVVAIVRWGEPYAVYLLIGGVLYLLGAMALTIVYHQPRNLALNRIDPAARESPARWKSYAAGWTRLNHLRTAATLAATGLLSGALGAG